MSIDRYQQGDENDAIQLLLDHGRRQRGLTRSDVVDLIPEAEFDPDLDQKIRATIQQAGIPFVEEPDQSPPPEPDTEEEAASPEVEDGLAGAETDDMVRLYIREAAQTPLLSAEDEIRLAQLVEDCHKAQEELARNPAEKHVRGELERRIETGREARERLIRANTRLVISVARKYTGRGLPLLDLIQEGNIGLMRAVRNFDYRRGYRFSTYATWWIRQAVTRALADQSRTIRLPAYMSDQVNRMAREQARLQHSLGRAPTLVELAEALDISPARVQQLQDLLRQPLSLQEPVGDEEDDELGSVIADQQAPDPEEAAMQVLSDEEVRGRLTELPPRERQVIELRYGLGGDAPLTLTEVGQRMGITRVRARQLEGQAMGRLRHPGLLRRRQHRDW